jgi:hypothetical protein
MEQIQPMSADRLTVWVMLGVVLTSLIIALTYYKNQELHVMQTNIESAIVKGIDPVAVRCAYARESDTVCMAYTLGLTGTKK